MSTQSNKPEPAGHEHDWLASLLLRRDPAWLGRLAAWYQRLRQMSHATRRRLTRQTAVTLGGAALLLALSRAPVHGNTIDVVDGEVAIVENGKCSLMEAIINARHQSNPQRYKDCGSADVNGPDTVVLPKNGEFVLTSAHNNQYDATGLPVITSEVIIEGNGSTIRRDTSYGTPKFRILAVDAKGI
ncbi:MAG: hypothetical protein R3C44_21405 [Chloroflexota bacterium]